MAVFILKDASVTINGVNLSDHVTEVELTGEAEMKEDTAMGDSWRSYIGGLKNWTLKVTFHQDFDAAMVDATLWPLLGAAAFPVSVKPTSAAVSATNPNYNGNALLPSYSPLAGAVGDLATVSVTFQGTGTLARATT